MKPEKAGMHGFGFVLTGAPDCPDMEWTEIAPAASRKKDFRYRCRASFGWKKGKIYYTDGQSLPLESCSGLFVGKLDYLDAKFPPN